MKKESKPLNKHPIRWLNSVFKGKRKNIVFLIIGNVVTSLLFLLTTYFLKEFGNAAQNKIEKAAIYSAVLLVAAVIVEQILEYTVRAFSERLVAKMENHLQRQVFENLLLTDYSYIRKIHSGEIMTHLTTDVNIVVDGVITLLPNLATLLTRLIGAFVLIMGMDPMLGFVFVLAGALFLLLASLFKSFIKKLHKNVQHNHGKLRSFLIDGYHGIVLVKAYAAYDAIRNQLLYFQNKFFGARIKRRNVQLGASFVTVGLLQAGYLFALIRGGFMLLRGKMQFGTLTALLQLVSKLQSPLSGLSGFLSRYYNMISSAERLIDLEQIPKDRKSQLETPNRDLYTSLDYVAFQNVSFKYHDDYIFKNVEFKLKKGDFVALTGLSGIGKSTFLQLLLGVLQPTDGNIVWVLKDGTEIDLHSLGYGLFSYVPQDKLLFSGSLRQAVTILNPLVDEEQLKKALDLVCATEFIASLSSSIQTQIGERGAGLSEGQLQRLSVARALLSDAGILLLDEATSALDETTERKLLQNIKSLSEKTCILISHRSAAKEMCDAVYVVEDQQIKNLI